MEEKRYIYSVKEVSAILKVNKGAVYDLIRSGLLRAYKYGTWQVPVFALEEFLRKVAGLDITDIRNNNKASWKERKEYGKQRNKIPWNKI